MPFLNTVALISAAPSVSVFLPLLLPYPPLLRETDVLLRYSGVSCHGLISHDCLYYYCCGMSMRMRDCLAGQLVYCETGVV